MLRTFCFLFFLIQVQASAAGSIEQLRSVVQDPNIFTQGLALDDEQNIYISSGLYGKSFLRQESAKAEEKQHSLAPHYFAEGLTVIDDRLYMLTWKSGLLFEFNASDLTLVKEYEYEGEGWGLTHDESRFYMSDGSHYVQFRRQTDFSIEKYLRVTHQGKPLRRINELEFAKGFLWANVWFSDLIYQIDIVSGEVIDTWDMSDLVAQVASRDRRAVLNGIAYDSQQDAFWVTGKLWPKRFLVKLNN